jgi:hypothetical protein
LKCLGLRPGVLHHEGHDNAGGAGSAGAPRAVQVVLGVGRDVEVHDAPDVVDVDAPRRDIRRHQGLGLSLLECGQRTISLRLTAVAVDGHGRHAHLRQLAGHLVGSPLGSAEHDRRPVLTDEICRQLLPLLPHGVDEVVRRAIVMALRWGHVAPMGIALVVAHQDVDGSVERRREQKCLASRLHLVKESPNLGEKAHVRHAVGLVDDDDVDLLETKVTAADEVGNATGATYGDVNTATERS